MEPNTEFVPVWIPDESLIIDHISEIYHWGDPQSGNFKGRVSITTYKLPGGIPHCRFAISRIGGFGTILRSYDHQSGCILWYPYRGTTYSEVRGKITNTMGYDETAAFLSTLHYNARLEIISKKEFIAIPPHTDEPKESILEEDLPTLAELFG